MEHNIIPSFFQPLHMNSKFLVAVFVNLFLQDRNQWKWRSGNFWTHCGGGCKTHPIQLHPRLTCVCS